MVWKIVTPGSKLVLLPAHFTSATMTRFIGQVVDEQRNAQCDEIFFDFSRLMFIAPEGVVVLCNLIEYLARLGVKVFFSGVSFEAAAIKYLDDSSFFHRYIGERVHSRGGQRSTTMPLQMVHGDQLTNYLYFQLIPWIGRSVGLTDSSLSVLRASLEEIFHNIRDHSGVDVGCTFSQHFPMKNEIKVAISDFGEGIPTRVRTKLPDLDDMASLAKAAEYGFTTKSNVRNRGVGIPTLMQLVTKKNTGTVQINSGNAVLNAWRDKKGEMASRSRASDGFYPGTLVQVTLRTDILEQLSGDAERESFEW